jgi:hypothetical protein
MYISNDKPASASATITSRQALEIAKLRESNLCSQKVK